MRDIDDLLPQVLVYAPNCSDVLARRYIREAAREFCSKADIWTERDTVTIVDPEGECLCTVSDAEILKIKSAKLDGIELTPQSADWLDDNVTDWDTAIGQARYITQIKPGAVLVAPRATGKLTMRVVLRPSIRALQLPDFLVDTYATEIGKGAAGRVLMHATDDGGANPALASALLGEFSSYLDSLPMKVARGQQGARPRTKGSFF